MKPRRLVLSSAALLATAAAAFADAYTPESVADRFVEPPTAAVVQIAGNRDDAVKTVDLPFEFPFFGQLETKVTVCSNGWLAFGTTAATVSDNPNLPSTVAPNGVVAPLWDDLTTGGGTVKTFVTGTAPLRTFVVAWDHVDTFSGASTADLSFEVLLYEGTGVVELAYRDGSVYDGLSYTSGIENQTGTLAFGGENLANGNSGPPSADLRYTPKSVIVSGSLRRERPAATATGLGTFTETGLAVAGADLVVVREDNGAVVARGRTRDDGTFDVAGLGADLPVKFALDVLASGAESRVTDAQGVVYRRRIATGIDADGSPAIGGINLDASVDATSPFFRRALNVQQAAQRAFSLANAYAAFSVEGTSTAAETFPPLEFRWIAGASAEGGSTVYVGTVTTGVGTSAVTTPALVRVHDGTDNPDPWDDDVLLRECGHHVLAAISVRPGNSTPHIWAVPTSLDRAWADGFATWWACVVQGRATFIDTKTAATADVFNLESATPAPQKAPTVTGAVACSLWDLVDASNETIDQFDGTLGSPPSTAAEVFRTIDIDMNALAAAGAAPFDVGSFLAKWRSTGTAEDRERTARIFVAYGAIADDPSEPNDNPGEASASPGTSGRVQNHTLVPSNQDRFLFPVTGDEGEPLTVVATQTTSTGYDVEIIAPGGAVLASGTTVGSANPQRLTVATPGPVPNGTYEVRVVWKAGGAASYSLAVFRPLRLTRTTLPEWTALQPFKEDFTATGGVAPFTFSITQTVPGLTVAEGGKQLTGTPTLAGTYSVHVRVTDGSGVGNAADADVALVINRPLRLPNFVGVEANVAVAADVGSGGTAAQWTAGTQPPAGFALADGATLRLTGQGAPQTFVISGSGSDAVGATVPLKDARVLVSPPVPPGAGSVAVPAGTHFGLAFDGVDGAKAKLSFHFSGQGATPKLVAIVDAQGNTIDVASRAVLSGRNVRLPATVLLSTGRQYAVFSQQAQAFTGQVGGGVRVTGVRNVHGLVVIPADDPDTVFDELQTTRDVQVTLVAGSRFQIILRSELIPQPVRPELIVLLGPDGGEIDARARTSRNGRRIETPYLRVAVSGVHTIRIGGDKVRSGPLAYRVLVRAPR